MKISPVINYKGYDVHIILGHYAYNADAPAMQLIAADTERNDAAGIHPNEPIAIATVNIEDFTPQPGECLIKSWSENEGMLEWLYSANIIQPTGQFVPTGFVLADVARLNEDIIKNWKEVEL